CRRRGVRAHATEGRDLLWRTVVGDVEGCSKRSPDCFRQRRTAARYLLRAADVAPAAWRKGRRFGPEGVRPRLYRRQSAVRTVRWVVAGRRDAPGLDEPWRPRRNAGSGLSGRRHIRRRTLCDRDQRRRQALYGNVPPGGGAHARRREAA